jgi:hypothetical protein
LKEIKAKYRHFEEKRKKIAANGTAPFGIAEMLQSSQK